MSRKPKIDENGLVGNWVVKDGSMVQDAMCERIQWLIDYCFEQIAVNGDNWSALYRNPDDRSYWELTYPNSHIHGGVPPMLQLISEDDACKRYNIQK
ncbi:MAG: Imm27 family immunity protein [Methylomonas sp.]